MASEGERWAEYFYPETYDTTRMQGTLVNKFGERDDDVLGVLEHAAAARRQRELMSGDVELPRTFDAQHVKAIHEHLFQDVYEWAGEYRDVPIYKGTPVGFADVGSGQVDQYLGDVHRLVEATPWARLNRDEFGERAAEVFAYLNQAHPFREGNGRTSKVFMEHVAELSSFTLDYDRVSPQQWNEASKWSGPDLMAYEPHPADLVPVFRTIAVDRDPARQAADEPASRAPRAVRASFPTSAADALRKGPSSTPQARHSGSTTPDRSYGTGRD
jgi:cell filamentation protein